MRMILSSKDFIMHFDFLSSFSSEFPMKRFLPSSPPRCPSLSLSFSLFLSPVLFKNECIIINPKIYHFSSSPLLEKGKRIDHVSIYQVVLELLFFFVLFISLPISFSLSLSSEFFFFSCQYQYGESKLSKFFGNAY